MYDSILVPTDGSDHAVHAAEHAVGLAGLFDATVHVLTAVDVDGVAGPFDPDDLDQEVVDRLEAAGDDALEAVEGVVDEVDDVRTARVTGRPARAILDYRDDHDIDLLAMGTHGRTGLSRYVMGSVTEHVIRESPVPVLSVRGAPAHASGEYDDVLIPTDGSARAAAAVDHGIAIAERTGARVHAVNIVDLGDLAASPNLSAPVELAAEFEAAGESATEAVAERARDAGVPVTTEVREGLPGKGLLQYAEGNDVDLIAMGTQGRTGLNRFLLGSTTERIVRHADAPVLAVNARDRDD